MRVASGRREGTGGIEVGAGGHSLILGADVRLRLGSRAGMRGSACISSVVVTVVMVVANGMGVIATDSAFIKGKDEEISLVSSESIA